MKKRVVITGIGVLACNGKGREEYWQALKEGKTGYRPATLFDTSRFNVDQAGEISDFDPKTYLGPKGLRTMDRSALLLVSAAKLAVDDCGLKITEENTDEIGVSVGTTLGGIRSINEFDEITLKEGPRYTNPALFPNTVINAPASQVCIWQKIKGFSTTISTGFTASTDAIKYAYDFIQFGRAKAVFAGGVEEMCLQTFYGFYALKFLSGSKGNDPFINCPFDARRNGITFAESAGLIALEEYEHARARKARILGEIIGFGYSFDPFRINKYNPRATGLKLAIQEALDDSGLSAGDIDGIYANANSTVAADKIETYAIKEIFGKYAYQIPISAIKSMIGETFSVSGVMATAAALGTFSEDCIYPTVNYKEKDPDCDLDYVPNQAREFKGKNILIITFGPNGSNSCVVLRRISQ